MQDKEMVNDVLSSLNASLTKYASAITESSNPQLRQTLQQIRDKCEQSQYDFFKTAEQKGFYKPAQPADQAAISQVKSQLGGGMS